MGSHQIIIIIIIKSMDGWFIVNYFTFKENLMSSFLNISYPFFFRSLSFYVNDLECDNSFLVTLVFLSILEIASNP